MGLEGTYYMCTPYKANITLVYSCQGLFPSILRIFPSSAENRLKHIPNMVYCCHQNCCKGSSVGLIQQIQQKNHKDVFYGRHYKQPGQDFTELMMSPHFWVAVALCLLAIVFLIQSVIKGVKVRYRNSVIQAGPSLRSVERSIEGPASSTRKDSDGIIIPEIVYFTSAPDDSTSTPHASTSTPHDVCSNSVTPRNGKNTTKETSLSEAADVGLNETPKQRCDMVTLSLDPFMDQHAAALALEKVDKRVYSPRSPSSPDEDDICVPVPLDPPYAGSQQVKEVWSPARMDRMYRYTNMQALVYPPGFVSSVRD